MVFYFILFSIFDSLSNSFPSYLLASRFDAQLLEKFARLWLCLQSLVMASRHTVAAAAATAAASKCAHPFNIILWRIGSNKTTTESLSRYFFSAANLDGIHQRCAWPVLTSRAETNLTFFLFFNSAKKTGDSSRLVEYYYVNKRTV